MARPGSRVTNMPTTIAAMLLLMTGVVASASFCGCGKSADEEASISVEQLKGKLSSNKEIIVVDVRTAEELSGDLGRLNGIIHIPLQELGTRHEELDDFKNRDLYVICRSGNRSVKAAELLRSKGYHAYNVEGGMTAWRAKYGRESK